MERFFAWLSHYRRLNTVFDRTKDHLIAFVSILSRRLKRLVTADVSANVYKQTLRHPRHDFTL
jgi:hypothetical protein